MLWPRRWRAIASPVGGEDGGKKMTVTFGPTAAAKILFVLRPNVFVAWDEPIRAGLRYDGSGHSYVNFLTRLREELLELKDQCRAVNLDWRTSPRQSAGRCPRPPS